MKTDDLKKGDMVKAEDLSTGQPISDHFCEILDFVKPFPDKSRAIAIQVEIGWVFFISDYDVIDILKR